LEDGQSVLPLNVFVNRVEEGRVVRDYIKVRENPFYDLELLRFGRELEIECCYNELFHLLLSNVLLKGLL